jgi:putative FmdB family regulatory protein
MPVYEFLCRDCDTRYDDLVGMDASMDEQACPECASSDVAKLYSPFRTKVSSGGSTVQIDGCLPGPAGQARAGGGCCGGGCGGCG